MLLLHGRLVIIIIIISLITQLTKHNHEQNVRKLINVFKKYRSLFMKLLQLVLTVSDKE